MITTHGEICIHSMGIALTQRAINAMHSPILHLITEAFEQKIFTNTGECLFVSNKVNNSLPRKHDLIEVYEVLFKPWVTAMVESSVIVDEDYLVVYTGDYHPDKDVLQTQNEVRTLVYTQGKYTSNPFRLCVVRDVCFDTPDKANTFIQSPTVITVEIEKSKVISVRSEQPHKVEVLVINHDSYGYTKDPVTAVKVESIDSIWIDD